MNKTTNEKSKNPCQKHYELNTYNVIHLKAKKLNITKLK